METAHNDEARDEKIRAQTELVAALVEKRDFHPLRDLLVKLEPADIAELIGNLNDADQGVIFRIVPRDLATDTFEHLSLKQQEGLMSSLGDSRVAIILNDMSPDDRTALLEEVPAQVAKQLLQLLSREERRVALTLLGYPEGSVGRLMTSEYVAVREEATVIEVFEFIREHGEDKGDLNVIYVVDAHGKLIDALGTKQLLLAKFGTKISDLINHQFVALNANQDQESAAQLFKKYDLTSLPVVESGGNLIGVVTIDDVIDVIEEEATEDIHKLGAVQALEDAYIRTPVLSLVKKRAGWLVLLMIGEMLTATAMGFFEGEIAKAVVLALFIPLIISSGGNSGSQAATLIIRALAVGEITVKDWWVILKRELASGVLLGVILGVIGFLRISLWSMFIPIYGPHWLYVAATVGASLFAVVIWGVVMGAMLPLLLKRCGVDPATSSAPFVATLVDVTGLVIYFTIAAHMLGGLLL